MKFKSIVLFALLACSTFAMNANSFGDLNPTEDLQKQLSEIVKESNIWKSADSSVKLMVTFTINQDGELVILSTSNSNWDSALKGALNYTKLDVNTNVKNKIFHLPISLEKVS